MAVCIFIVWKYLVLVDFFFLVSVLVLDFLNCYCMEAESLVDIPSLNKDVISASSGKL